MYRRNGVIMGKKLAQEGKPLIIIAAQSACGIETNNI
jgi:hypothetical protein